MLLSPHNQPAVSILAVMVVTERGTEGEGGREERVETEADTDGDKG